MKLVSRSCLVFLSALLIFPAAVKLAHIFADHEHYYCEHYSESHFHQETLDCDLLEFQQVPFPSLELFSYSLHQGIEEKSSIFTSYYFLNEHQELPFALRGPPEKI